MNPIQTIGMDEAQTAIEEIKKEMIDRKLFGVIAVADAVGELISLLKLDNAPRASILIATNKAWTAAREAKSSGQLGKESKDPKTGFDMAFFGDSRYIGWGGGVPIKLNNVTIGAVGVSGLSEELDEELAVIGVDAILSSL